MVTTSELISELNEIIQRLESFRDKLAEEEEPKPEPEDSGKYRVEDLVMLARAMAGEGAGLFGEERDEVALWIGHAALNYWETNWWMTKAMLKAMLANEPERLIRALNALSQNDRQALREIVHQADVTKYRYHGTTNVEKPPEWAIKLAARALHRDGDITQGAIFMLSGVDLKNMGKYDRRGEAIRGFRGPKGHEFYFFRKWVG
jgi:hypothetical protein